jgi:NAD(P)H-dependent flavin oxidoreductase YrpB (nitropropane dioxygenase family)
MHPEIIQGGMGVGISSWMLAKTVARQGQLGVVSGTALDATLVRHLWAGDPSGNLRRAIAAFPGRDFAEELVAKYFQPDGREPDQPFPNMRMLNRTLTDFQERLLVLSNFVEVFLAKEGHGGSIGINYLMKMPIPVLPSLYGALLAGVDYVLMGAGIPREIPGALDALAEHKPSSLRLEVLGGTGADDEFIHFDPADRWPEFASQKLTRPAFFPIVSSDSLATMMSRKANGSVEGFIVEAPIAGGHNAPPRGDRVLTPRGEPKYGPRDQANLDKVSKLGLPFWLAGGSGSPEGLRAAKAAGARGIQVGTLFAYSDESGLRADLRQSVIDQAIAGETDVLTDGRASPTGFPFKVASHAGTLSETDVYEGRNRICDLGYLRTVFRRDDGRISYRCPSEPVGTFVKKGGTIEDTVGRKCLCNALIATLDIAQVRKDGSVEPSILTSGDDLNLLGRFLKGRTSYSAEDVLDYLLEPLPAEEPTESEKDPSEAVEVMEPVEVVETS